jgi:hypothetical protein
MIADALRYEIELHAQRVNARNRFLDQARCGDVAPEAVGRYLIGLRYMIGNTPPNLRRAALRAAELGRPDLVAYFENKLGEEDGHEEWAIDDLRAFSEAYGISPDPTPVPAIAKLQAFLEETIDADPTLYLSYVFWAEYFVLLVGADFVQCLVTRCGLPSAALTCLAKHIVLDEGHTDDNIDAIDALVPDPARLAEMRHTLRNATNLFDRATDQMLGLGIEETRVAS